MPTKSRRGRRYARRAILKAVNAARRWSNQRPLGARHIQRAVFIARQRRLVDATTLTEANFRPYGDTR